MIQTINAPIAVVTQYNHVSKITNPTRLSWGSREYVVTKIGFHHHYWQGRTLIHVFSVATATMFFRLELNTENLQWHVTEIADGLPN